jgi:hypothetical protein
VETEYSTTRRRRKKKKKKKRIRLHLVTMALSLCLAYTLKHSHGAQYTSIPANFRPNLSFIGLSVWLFSLQKCQYVNCLNVVCSKKPADLFDTVPSLRLPASPPVFETFVLEQAYAWHQGCCVHYDIR